MLFSLLLRFVRGPQVGQLLLQIATQRFQEICDRWLSRLGTMHPGRYWDLRLGTRLTDFAAEHQADQDTYRSWNTIHRTGSSYAPQALILKTRLHEPGLWDYCRPYIARWN